MFDARLSLPTAWLEDANAWTDMSMSRMRILSLKPSRDKKYRKNK